MSNAEAELAGVEWTSNWIVANTPQGRGTYILGEEGSNVLVLAPPGVRLPTPAGSDAPLCSKGWRMATFCPVGGEPPLVDRHRPADVEELSIVDALAEVLVRCPQRLPWLADRLEEQIRSTWLISQPDANGEVPQMSAQRREERDQMLDELTPALHRLAGTWPVGHEDPRLTDPDHLVTLRDELDAFPGSLS